jgi:hypothetical protein
LGIIKININLKQFKMEKKRLTTEQVESKITELTTELQNRLRELDPELIAELRIGRGLRNEDGHFSDWHDNWNDRDRWSKTWGKAGGKATFDFEDFDSNFRIKE